MTAQLNAQGRLASTLAGTQVLFDNIPAPLVYAAAAQVSAIVPYEVANQQTTQMVVVSNGQSTHPVEGCITMVRVDKDVAPETWEQRTKGVACAAPTSGD